MVLLMYIKMDWELNNLEWLICHKNQTKPKQIPRMKSGKKLEKFQNMDSVFAKYCADFHLRYRHVNKAKYLYFAEKNNT